MNPVLREGNSDRRAAAAVKKYAQNNPHRMGEWTADSKTTVSAMSSGDFFSNEKSTTLAEAATAKIVLETAEGETVLKEAVSYPAGTVVDATFMSAAALDAFLAEQIEETKKAGTLFSLHMKATMMKVSDPIIFGHAVKEWLKPVFDKYGDKMKELGVNPNGGLGALLERVKDEPEILAAIEAVIAARPPMYMVNSDKGITNLHVPSDVIIDASLPALIRAGGKGWGPDNKEHDTNCVIPDSSYAAVYAEAIKDCKANGALDPTTAGTVQNVGLMAQKAEEYGSHPTTFEMPAAGTVKMILDDGTVLHSHSVEKGDIWRSASARKAPIEDWVNLAIERQAETGYRAIFWLDEARAHDAELISFVKPILEAKGVADKFEIMAPREATVASLETITKGENTIAITGNVLRDYLTDLFPILELATSAKMLSIVKLMQGGGLFETGAGGSAPKHVQQLMEQNHLRWDSWASSVPSARASSSWAMPRATPRQRCWARRWMPQRRASSTTAARPRARSGNPTTATATTGSPATGPKPWRPSPTTRTWPATSPRSRPSWPRRKRRSPVNWPRPRARRSIWAATTTATSTRPLR